MKSYSLKPEFSQKYPGENHQENDNLEQLELDAPDWESQIAKLVGFEEESPSENIEQLVSELGNPDISEPTIVESSTEHQQPLSSNPFAKLALVGGVTFSVVLVAGVFLTQIMSVSNQKPKNNLTSQVTSLPPKVENEKPKLEQEIETLKTKLALAEQVQTVTEAQKTLRTQITARPENPPSNNIRTRPVQPVQPVQATPAPRVVTRIIEKPYSPPTPAVTTIPTVTPTITPSIAPPSPPDPMEEWRKLAKLGSYGQAEATNKPSANTARLQPINTPNNSNLANIRRQSQPQETSVKSDILVSQTPSRNSKLVKTGTSSKAVLLTAVFGETTRVSKNQRTNTEDGNEQVFVVQLKEPLKTVDGEIALPANTELLTQINSISEQGLLKLDVTKIVVQNNGQIQEKSLPDNAITVRAPQGKPLLASKFPDNGSSIAKMDAGLFVLGGISKAAELLNRIDTQVTTNAGSTVINNSSGQRNLTAGIVEGGLKSVVPQISQRNQQAIVRMMQQTNVWFIPAGQQVEIYVNRTMPI